MRIAVCDDETVFIDMIEGYCREVGKELHIPISLVKFKSGKDVISYIRTNRNIDLFILDIVMEDVNGLQIAEKIRESGIRAKVVFLTSASEYAMEGYRYAARYYWMKPLDYSRFVRDLSTIQQELSEEAEAFLIENIGTAIEKVYYSDILYIETKGRKVCVHRKRGEYISTRRLMEYEKILGGRFHRCHAAYIVNLEYVTRVQGLEIELSSGERIYMSKGRKKSFLTALSEYLGEHIG